MKLISTVILIITLVLSSFISANAQKNIINPKYSGFENNGKGWYFPPKKEFKISKIKAYKGKNSVKFFTSSHSSSRKKYNLVCNEPVIEGRIKPGTYKLSLQVWAPTTHPKAFFVSIAEKDKKSTWIQTKLPLNKVSKMKWQTVEATVKVSKKIISPRIFISVPVVKNSKDFSGSFYIDDIQLVRVKK